MANTPTHVTPLAAPRGWFGLGSDPREEFARAFNHERFVGISVAVRFSFAWCGDSLGHYRVTDKATGTGHDFAISTLERELYSPVVEGERWVALTVAFKDIAHRLLTIQAISTGDISGTVTIKSK